MEYIWNCSYLKNETALLSHSLIWRMKYMGHIDYKELFNQKPYMKVQQALTEMKMYFYVFYMHIYIHAHM